MLAILPSYQALMTPVLIALKGGDVLSIPQIHDRVVKALDLNEELINLRIALAKKRKILCH